MSGEVVVSRSTQSQPGRDERGRFVANGMGPASGKPASGAPARGSRPPFQVGNTVAVRHGAYSVLTLKPRAEEIVASLRLALGEEFDPKFTSAVEAAGVAGARVEAAAGVLLDELDEEKSLRLSADARSWLRTYVAILERLGLTPKVGTDGATGPVTLVIATAFPGVRRADLVVEAEDVRELPEGDGT